MRIAFIGLGVMGYSIAGHLAKAGHQVTVYNRTSEKAAKWCMNYSGIQAFSPAAAVETAEAVFSCVGNDDDVRQITLGEQGAFRVMSTGSLYIDHTTTSAEIARVLYQEARQRGVYFLDAPVSGGQSGAEKGQLSVMVGGDANAYTKVRPLLAAYAKSIEYMGSSGTGQLSKMVNQICIAGLVQALAEGLYFARAVDLNIERLLKVISQGAAQSWQMDNRSQTMLASKFDFGFAVDWMRKDLGFVLNEARCRQLDLPVTALVDTFYEDIQAMGGGRWDTSSLIARLGEYKNSVHQQNDKSSQV